MENPADIQLGEMKGHETMVAGPDRDRRALSLISSFPESKF